MNIEKYQLCTILFIIMIVLILFIAMYYKYNISSNISSNISKLQFTNIDSITDQTQILELLEEAKKMAKEKFSKSFSKEKFELINQATYNNYMNELSNIQNWLATNSNTVLADIKAKLDTLNEDRQKNKDKILTLLTNIYMLNYISKINKDNAEVYKVYLKYNDPKKNIYYRPYLD